ncbi:MAG: hypothetical protein QXH44_09920 [Pyrobaculum sp.]
MNEKISGKVISFAELRKTRNPFGTEKIDRLDSYINKEIVIKDYKVDEGMIQGKKVNFVYILAIDPEKGEEVTLRTTSEVILKQLRQLEPYLKEGYLVKAKVIKKKRYLSLG